MSKLAPSILSADFARLGEEATALQKGHADYIHIDVMDGHFVPNISFGADVMKSLDKLDTPPYDVHLMIENPDDYLEDFITSKTEYIVVHQEACRHLHRTIQHIKSKGIKAGVALNPATPVGVLECILGELDLVLIMSVNPGFGGQKLIPETIDKIRKLEKLKKKNNYNYEIEIDGGVNIENVQMLCEAGVNIAVAGSAVFGADDIVKRVEEFKSKM